MQLSTTTQTGQPAISSLEIAAITGKEHGNVIRDIRIMLIGLYGDEEVERIVPEHRRNRKKEFISENADAIFKAITLKYKDDSDLNHPVEPFWDARGFRWERDKRGYITHFQLDKSHSLTLVSGYDEKLRKAIIDRWQELEAKQSFQIPQTLPDALRLAADLADKVQEQAAALSIAAPKVEFYDTVTKSSTVCQMAVAAQVAKLPFGRNNLFKKLREDGILISGGNRHNLPKQTYIDKGLFTVEETSYKHPTTEEPIVKFTTYVTQKGIDFLIKNYKTTTA